MKTRNGFVSNSSSSSFVIVGKIPDNFHYDFVEIENNETKLALSERVEMLANYNEAMYLTQFISDGYDWDFFHENPHSIFQYSDGAHSGPYGEEYFDNLNNENVWILKEDNHENEIRACIE